MISTKRLAILLPPLLLFLALFYALHVRLPHSGEPLLFYANQNRDDLKALTLEALKSARENIHMRTYTLSDPKVMDILNKKAAEGLDIEIFYHKKANSALEKRLHPTVKLHPIEEKGLMHEKILIIDASTLFLGSANMTSASLSMHDNLVIGLYSPHFAHYLLDGKDLPSEGIELGTCSIQYYPLPTKGKEGLARILAEIGKAQTSISIAMFTFTHPVITEALIQAKERGVKVKVFIDSRTARGASKKAIDRLTHEGISCILSEGYQLYHHKWALIDQEIFISGSANWTDSAFKKNRDFFMILSKLPKSHTKAVRKLIK